MRIRMIPLSILAGAILGVVSSTAIGQVATGIYPGGAFDSKGFDTINLGNLNAHFEIPIFSKSGRGIAFQHALVYDSAIWTKVGTAGSEYWRPVPNWGWQGGIQNLGGDLQFFEGGFKCWDDADHTSDFFTGPVDGNFSWTDQSGHTHTFGLASITSCDYPIYGVQSGVFPADDNSGLLLVADTFYGYHILMPDGRIYYPTYNGTPGTASATDTNGNQITESASGAAITYTDTTGSAVLTVNGAGDHTSPRVLTYPTYVSGSSGTASVSVYYASYSIQTAFGCSGVTEYAPSSSVDLVDHIQLADGQAYSFTYESTPGASGKTTGRLASITLPGGGRINYQYSGGSNGIVCHDGGTATLTRTMPDDPAGSSSWVYSRTLGGSAPTPSHTDVTDGMSTPNHAAYDFVSDPADYYNNMFATQRIQYDGAASGTPLLSELTCYNGATSSCVTQAFSLPITATEITTTLDGASVKKTTKTFDSYGSLTAQTDYDFGTSSPGAQVSAMTISYATLGNGIMNRPAVVSTYGSQSSPMQIATYAYDGAALTATSGLPQHVGISGSRGNLTSVSVATSSSGSLQTQSNTYNDAGQIVTTTDALNHSTTYAYETSAGAFLSSVTFPSTGSIAHGVSMSYDVPTGLLLSSTGDSGASTSYTYDNMLRPVSVALPASGSESYTYSLASSSPSVTKSTQHSVGSYIDTISKLDGYGRLARLERSDVAGNSAITYGYDADGRLRSVGNPFFAGSSATPDLTTSSYDGLGRPRSVVDSDGISQSTFSYLGDTLLFADEASKQRKVEVDAIGRISRVLEPNSTGGLTIETIYQYDQNQTSGTSTPETYQTVITQKGGSSLSTDWRVRTFTYDTLGRALSSTTPEAGTITYTYLNSGSACAADLSLPCRRTDANTTTTSYAYDALNRLTGKSYSGTSSPGTTIASNTPSIAYSYDQTSYNGLTIANGKGRQTGMSDGSGATAWSFDTAGNLASIRKTINSVTKQASFTYNDDYSEASITDFGGTSYSLSYDRAGHLTDISDSYTQYASLAEYDASGRISFFAQLPPGSPNPYETRWLYNSRRQPIEAVIRNPNNDVLLQLDYSYGASGTNNGNILSVNAGGDIGGIGVHTFTYDQLNRLSTASNSSTWGQTYTYDNWGNLYDVARIGSLGGQQWTATSDAHNRLSTQTYDAAGQITVDEASRTFSYDAEGRLLSAGSGAYVYDGNGQRVKKTAGSAVTLYWPSLGSVSNESNFNGTSFWKQVYFAGKQVYGESPSSGGLFLFPDHLGSVLATGDASGNPSDYYDYLPFGTLFANYASSYGYSPSDNHYTFTGYESDQSENGTDYAVFRSLTTQTGRFNRPDPYDGSYETSNPQSFNRYSYVLNSPMVYRDPSGLEGLGAEITYNLNYDDGYVDLGSVCWEYGLCNGNGGQPNGADVGGGGSGGADGVGYVGFLAAGTPPAPTKSIGPNPCAKANPANLNYFAFPGTNSGYAHIVADHIFPSLSKSFYSFDLPYSGSGPIQAPGKLFAVVVAYNAYTLSFGTLTAMQGTLANGNATISASIPSNLQNQSPINPGAIGFDYTQGGAPTEVNSLVVRVPGCSAVLTSFPGRP